MIIYFWLITALLLICAFAFFLPWVRDWQWSICLMFVFSLSGYGLYAYWGSSHYLRHYYSIEEQHYRLKQADFQLLLAEFRKAEFRLRLRLEQNPNDSEAEWQLLDLLAIKALQDNNYPLAIAYWNSALEKVPQHLKLQFKEKIKQLSQTSRDKTS